MDNIPLTISIAEAVRMAGIGRTSLYAAITSGRLKTRKYGRRRLVETQALRSFIEALPESSSSRAA
jgi:excisionase family DNA binding protein